MDCEKIPFLDLNSLHREYEQEFINAFREIVVSGKFISGPSVEQFEREFASFCGANFAVGVGSGTDALRFALIASGVREGDVVITVPNTFIATVEAISQAGAKVAFVDVEEKTSNMSSLLLREYLSTNCLKDRVSGETITIRGGRTVRAIIPVHLYGQPADMDSIQKIAEEYKLVIIEDACQAHGARYYSQLRKKWVGAGTVGTAAAFSFYPGKNLGAFGEAGAVTTNDPDVAAKVKMLRDHGQAKKYVHEMEGYNGRLDSIQASVLSIKLKFLEKWNEKRRQIAAGYAERLNSITDLSVPSEQPWSKGVYHLYVIHTDNRDQLQKFLYDNGVETGLHYPIPLHLQSAYQRLGYKEGSFPVSEKLAWKILSLPMFPSLTADQQNKIAALVHEFHERLKK